MRRNTKLLPRIVSVTSSLMFLFLVIGYFAGWLGSSSLRNAHLWTGRVAFFFLLLSLTITPLRTITGWSIIIPLRKTFGLNAFYWASAHMLVFTVLIYHMNLPAILEAFSFRRFIIPGAFAFLILAVLALTTVGPIKKAVKKIWRRIHMWVYPANVLVLLHYSGATSQEGEVEPLVLIAAVYVAILFILRLKPVKMAIIRRRLGTQQIDMSSN